MNGPQIFDVLLTASHPNGRAAPGAVEDNASLSMMDGREEGREGIVPRKRVGRQDMLHWRISVRFIKLSYVRISRG
jgi:hypothetical protein